MMELFFLKEKFGYKETQMAIEYLKGGQYKVLSDGELYDIHLATLEVLEEVGVRVEYKPALDLMADNGCRVDF
jgi:trimethylamine--corrinoid protein Co-methyltransferase